MELSKSLVIDKGNSRLKLALFNGNELLESYFPQKDYRSFVRELIDSNKIENAMYSASGNIDKDILEDLKSVKNFYQLSSELHLPVVLDYETPSTLGSDRIANASAATALYPGKNTLVVDLGTCITYDVIDKDAVYKGGAISPGPHLRSKAMNDYTARLPIVEIPSENHLIGKNTIHSLESGVFNGVVFEIEGFIDRIQRHFNALTIIFTGGYADIFVNAIKYPIFADPNLTLKGLNEILLFNVGRKNKH